MLDPALEEALAEVVGEAGLSEAVARRLTAWLRRMSEGELVREDNVVFLSEACSEIRLEDEDAD